MSTLRVDGIRSNSATSDAITLASDGTCTANITNNLSNRNKIINGSQQIFQRGTSELRTGGNDGYYNGIADRWAIRMHSSMGQTTFSQDTSDTPDGFGSSQKLVRANAGSSNTAKYFVYDTKLEGQDLQDFAKGTSSAKKFTLSFYVKTGVSGVYCIEIRDLDNNRMVGGTYTVSNSNWNKYTLSFPADTTGKFDNDNNASLWVRFWLAAGSSFTSGTARTTWGSFSGSDLAVGQTAQVGDNPADTWQITGVQLEVGSFSSDFEFRSFGQELALCQRYYETSHSYGTAFGTNTSEGKFLQNGTTNGAGNQQVTIYFRTTKRANPTVTGHYDGTVGSWFGARQGAAAVTGVYFDLIGMNSFRAFNAIGAIYVPSEQIGHWQADSEL